MPDDPTPTVRALFPVYAKPAPVVRDDAPAEPKPRRFRYLHELLANPTRPRWLLKDVLEAGVIGLLMGPRGTFKSFIAMHWAMQLVMAGIPVAVISAEGSGFERRARAWLMKHRPDFDLTQPLPLLVLEQRVNFNDPDSVRGIVAEIEAENFRPQLVVIDTLSKNSGGLDENSNSEVKAFIGYLDTYLKRHFDAAVLLLHHTGHNERGRARGASALEADTDAAYVITRNGTDKIVTVTRERFKDSGDMPPLTYEAHVIEVGGEDEYGQPITSLALTAGDPEVVPSAARQPRSGPQRQVLRILRDLQAEATAGGKGTLVWDIPDIRMIAKGAGLAKTTARDVAAALCQFYLQPSVGGYRLEGGK